MEEQRGQIHTLVGIAWCVMTIKSAEEFIRLRYSENPDEYSRAASEDASPEVWRSVIAKHPEARFWVAQNKTVPLEILKILASDEDPRVRGMVARKRKLSPDLLDLLSRDSSETVRLQVARHRHTSRDTLDALTTDAWDQVREVARERLEKDQAST